MEMETKDKVSFVFCIFSEFSIGGRHRPNFYLCVLCGLKKISQKDKKFNVCRTDFLNERKISENQFGSVFICVLILRIQYFVQLFEQTIQLPLRQILIH